MHDAIRGHSTPVAKAHGVLGDAETHLIEAEKRLEILSLIELARENGEPVSNGLAADVVAEVRAALRSFRDSFRPAN